MRGSSGDHADRVAQLERRAGQRWDGGESELYGLALSEESDEAACGRDGMERPTRLAPSVIFAYASL